MVVGFWGCPQVTIPFIRGSQESKPPGPKPPIILSSMPRRLEGLLDFLLRWLPPSAPRSRWRGHRRKPLPCLWLRLAAESLGMSGDGVESACSSLRTAQNLHAVVHGGCIQRQPHAQPAAKFLISPGWRPADRGWLEDTCARRRPCCSTRRSRHH